MNPCIYNIDRMCLLTKFIIPYHISLEYKGKIDMKNVNADWVRQLNISYN